MAGNLGRAGSREERTLQALLLEKSRRKRISAILCPPYCGFMFDVPLVTSPAYMGRRPGASEYIQPAGPWLIAELDLTRAIQILLHAEHHVSRLLRPLRVGNEDDLPVVRHLIKQGLDSADVAIVQRGLHLIKNK